MTVPRTGASTTPRDPASRRSRMLIEPARLEERLGEPGLRIFDCSVALLPKAGGGLAVVSGRAAYESAHVPGAGFLDLIEEFSDPEARLPFTRPSAQRFASAISRHGVGSDSRVVLYNSGPTMWSTRMYMQLRSFGFERVLVLDGGFDRWLAEGRPVSAQPCPGAPARFEVRPAASRFVDRAEVLHAVTCGDRKIVNALAPPVFRGDVVAFGRPGHIATSTNLPATELLDPKTQAFLPTPELESRLRGAGLLDGPPTIAYCGGGVAATTIAFALGLAGRDDAVVYDGSMNEWGLDPTLPMERGDRSIFPEEE